MSDDLCPACGRALVPLCRLCNVVADSNLRTIVDVLDDNWMEVCKSLGCVHEQSMGLSLPGTSTEVLAAIERLRRERDEARRELAELERITGRFVDPREEDALREANEALAEYEEALARHRAGSEDGDT